MNISAFSGAAYQPTTNIAAQTTANTAIAQSVVQSTDEACIDSASLAASEKQGCPVGRAVKDAFTGAKMVSAGLLYRNKGKKATEYLEQNPPLSTMPSVRLERPYLMVPGWTTTPQKFDALVGKLTEDGTNGGQAYYVQNGQFFSDGALTKPLDKLPADAKVFIAVFENNHQDPSLTAPQLKRSLEAIRLQTNEPKVDVEGYSMGGLSTRLFLDQDGSGVGKVMLLGTPNQGTRFAELSRQVIKRDIQFAMSLAHVGPIDLPAFDWLANGHNEKLSDLNSRFTQQAAKAEDFMILGADSLPTPGKTFMPVRRGDGMVAAKYLKMEGVETKLLRGRPSLHHGSLPSDSGVYMERAKFFGWAPVS